MKLLKTIVSLHHTSYPIYIGNHLLEKSQIFKTHLAGSQVMIVTNETLATLYLPTVIATLQAFSPHTIILPDGEQYKTAQQFHEIINTLVEHHHHRDTTIIALGGGVVSDLAGFAAACYQRGVAFIPVPTTLLAMVDASIGGKTAINHPQGKNVVGAFHQPAAVIIDIQTLRTLPEREFRAGIAEIVKAALIKDASFFNALEKNMSLLLQQDHHVVMSTIQHACDIKRRIVMEDEKEKTGTRALLNLGHTLGHAIEQMMGYGTWLHGEAVAVGMVLAAKLSQQKGWLTANIVHRIEKLLQQAALPIGLPTHWDVDTLWSAMQMDKKISSDRLSFVLLQDIGQAVLTQEVTAADIQAVLRV